MIFMHFLASVPTFIQTFAQNPYLLTFFYLIYVKRLVESEKFKNILLCINLQMVSWTNQKSGCREVTHNAWRKWIILDQRE